MPVVMGNSGTTVQTGGGGVPVGTGVPGVASPGFVPGFVAQRQKTIADKRADMAKNPSAYAGWRKDESGKSYWYDPQAGPTGVVEGVGEGVPGRADAFAVRKQAQNAFDQRGALTRKIPPHQPAAAPEAEPVSTYGTSSVTLTGSTAPPTGYAPLAPSAAPSAPPAPAPAPMPVTGYPGGGAPVAAPPLQYGHQAPVPMPFVPIGQTLPAGAGASAAGPSAAQAAGTFGAQAYGASTGKGFAPANAPNSAQAAQQGAAYGQRTDRNAQRLGIQSYNQSPTAYQRPGIYASLNPSTNQKVIY